MFKKLNTTTLLIILAILGAIVLFNKFYLSKKQENTFSGEFVSIDTSLVTSIFISPGMDKEKAIRIIKNGNHWELQNEKNKTMADSNAVRSLLASFADMKSVSLAGQDKSTWSDLHVNDSSGTKVRITTSGDQSYNIVIGKISFDPATQGGLTYVRKADEEAVYAIPGYLSFMVSQPFDSWRNKVFMKGNKDNWTSITFNYPGDSSFVLTKANNDWIVNGVKADSTKTVQYLNQLGSIQGNGFVDGYSPSSTPVFSISISGNNQPTPISIQAYPADSTKKFILHSSLNPDAYFSESESHLKDRIFIGKKSLMN